MITIVKFLKVKRSKFIIVLMLLSLIITSAVLVGFTRKTITVVVDGSPIKLVTYQQTFDLALKNADIYIAAKDKVDKELNSKIVQNDIITIIRAINIKVFVDDKELIISSAEKDIELMLKAESITLGPTDKISPSVKTNLSANMDVIITRVKTKTIKEKESIAFKTVTKTDKDILKSISKVSQTGVKGEKTITIEITYEDGKEVSRKVIKETVVKKPKNKIIVKGTKSPAPAPVTISRGSTAKVISAKPTNITRRTLRVKSTAYWAFNGINKSYTSSGRLAVRNPNGFSTIAVDPRIIPLGTRLYVEGYGNAIAADTGSSVKGNYIDVFFNTRQEALNWGVRYLTITILD
jgi:uncharacterized protein YabE (DUF348 family)